MNDDKQKVLSEEERDAFRGTTIDEDGNAHTYEDRQRDVYRDRVEQQSAGGFNKYSVHTVGCGTGAFIFILIMCVIGGMFFFVLPFYVIGIIIAMIGYGLLKLFK